MRKEERKGGKREGGREEGRRGKEIGPISYTTYKNQLKMDEI